MKRWIGPGIGAVLVIFLIWRMPWLDVLKTLKQARLGWWMFASALGACGIWFRALRLHWVLGTSNPVTAVWRCVSIGYLAGLVIPAGGGEVVKIRMLMKNLELDIFHIGSAVTLDRLLDLAGLAFGLTLLGWLQELPGTVGTLLRAMSLMLSIAAVIWALILIFGKRWLTRLSSQMTHSPWFMKRISQIHGALDANEHLRSGKIWIKLLLFQGFITGFEVCVVGIALKTVVLAVTLPPWASLQVLMFASIGFAIPLLPGSAGSLQVSYILALRPFGVSIPQALAFSLLAQLAHVLVVLGHGGFAMILGPMTRRLGKAGIS